MMSWMARIVVVLAGGVAVWLVPVIARALLAARTSRTVRTSGTYGRTAACDAPGPVRILAFSSDSCAPCHTVQQPVLRRVLAARSGAVQVDTIDADRETELVKRYGVLTVPTTVVLDPNGRVYEVNYGLAREHTLLEQVDAVLQRAGHAVDPLQSTSIAS